MAGLEQAARAFATRKDGVTPRRGPVAAFARRYLESRSWATSPVAPTIPPPLVREAQVPVSVVPVHVEPQSAPVPVEEVQAPEHERAMTVTITRHDDGSVIPLGASDVFIGMVGKYGLGMGFPYLFLNGKEYQASAPTYRGYSPEAPEADPAQDTDHLADHVGIFRILGQGGEYYAMVTDNLSSQKDRKDCTVEVHAIRQTREELMEYIAQAAETNSAARFLHKLHSW